VRVFTILLACMVALPASAQQKAATDKDEIVVTGVSIKELKDRLYACLARHCSPKEDIDASLNLAETEFVAGDYDAARQTIAQSHHRNDRFAKTFPVDVADLNRAWARVNDASGFVDTSRIQQIQSLDALKAGLGKNDSRVLTQRLMVADSFAKIGRIRAADDMYNEVARQARKAGLPTVVGMAMLRDAVLYGAVASKQWSMREPAKLRLSRLEQTTEPELAPFRDAVKVLRARLAMMDGDQAAFEKVVADMPPRAERTPLLLYAPPISTEDLGRSPKTRALAEQSQWIDLQFRVSSAGKVSDVAVLRDSGNLDEDWPTLVKRRVAERRYAPMALPDGSELPTRIERFSFVHDVTSSELDTRTRARSATGRITSLDLTPDGTSG
jgi:hypothetical protein